MFKKLLTASLFVFAFLVFSNSEGYSQTMYFCEGVDDDGYAISSASVFNISRDGGYLYILVRSSYEVGCNTVKYVIYRNGDYDNTIYLDTEKSRHLEEVSLHDRYNLFIILTNYCNAKVSNGNESFREDRFILDKEFIKSGALLVNKNIHVFYFNSAASNASMIGEDKWAESFIAKHKSKIEPGIREFAVNYLKALILFIKKDYDSALMKISRIKTTFPNQKQNIRNLMLQIYYDTGSFDNALSIIDASLHFLKTEKNIPDSYRKSSTNFIKLASAIIRQKLSSRKEDTRLLKKKLESGEFQNKTWLFQKINQLD